MIEKIRRFGAFKVVVVGMLGIFVALGAWTFVGAAGTEVQMCVKNSGVSYIIGTGFNQQSCSSNEQLITFNVQGPQGIQGPAGPVGPQGPEGGSVKVYDGNNQVIGYLVTADGEGVAGSGGSFRMSMFDKQLKVIVTLGYNYGDSQDYTDTIGYAASNGISVKYFANSDCSGQAYAPLSPKDTYLLLGDMNAVDHTMQPISQFVYQSRSPSSDMSPQNCGNESDVLTKVYPVKDVTDILNSYVRPFRVGL